MKFLQSLDAKIMGAILIAAGVVGLVAAVIMSYTIFANIDRGSLPAVSFLLMMIGMAFYFPTLLQEAQGEISTMRVIVFAVVMMFAVLYVKLGWNAGTFETFSIDDKWVYILGLAFGSKAFQKFGETETKKTEVKTPGKEVKTEKQEPAKGTDAGNATDNS
jgi:hypothetical protein